MARFILMYETTTNPVHRERLDEFFDIEHESAIILKQNLWHRQVGGFF